MAEFACRGCSGTSGEVVLDLGDQPACDYFPARDDPGPDPMYPLRMWLCATCALAQLMDDPTIPEEPRGAEPVALAEHAVDAVARVDAAGWLRPGTRVAEFGSPHGGSWLPLLSRLGISAVDGDQPADVVLDCFGMMHCADQAGAVTERVSRLAPGGVILLQFHSLATILRLGQWNSLRHGHYAYYSLSSLGRLLAAAGLSMRQAWQFDLYGGTVLVTATRTTDSAKPPEPSVGAVVAEEELVLHEPHLVQDLQHTAMRRAHGVHQWLSSQRAAGSVTVGYGAASRAVALLSCADVDSSLLPWVADASPAKQGRRMPGTDIPVASPAELVSARPDAILLFLSDLMAEVRRDIPEVELAGGRWVDVETLCV